MKIKLPKNPFFSIYLRILMVLEYLASSTLKKSKNFFVLDLSNKNNLISLSDIPYDEYIANQKKKTSIRLLNNETYSWVDESTIERIVGYLESRFGITKLDGICQGTRAGKETEWFLKYLDKGSTVFGTEIDENAASIPNTVIHDFHEYRSDWHGMYDFVYSNSHDHALDPKKAFNNWMKFLKQDGLLFLEHSRSHGRKYVDNIDVLGIETEFLPYVFLDWFQGQFSVTDMINIRRDQHEHVVFVIEKLSNKKRI